MVAIAPAASANGGSGPVSPDSFQFQRASTSPSSFLVKPSETATIEPYTYVSEAWTGWPLRENTVLSRNTFDITSLPSGVIESWENRYWNAYNFQVDGCDFYEDTPTMRLPDACVNQLFVGDTIEVENSTNTDATVGTNAASLRVKYGKKTFVASEAVVAQTSTRIELLDAEAVTLTDTESDLNLNFEVCLAEETLAEGDVLTVHPVMTRGGADTDFTLDEFDGALTNLDNPGAGITYEVPAPEEGEDLQNLAVYLYFSVDETVAGTYAGTVDFKLNGTSVTELCPDYEPGWPELSSSSGVVGSAGADISGRYNVPTDAYTANENFDQYSSSSDGFGGMFYWGFESDDYEDNDNAVVSVVHMDGSTPSDDLAGAGEIIVNTGRFGFFQIARYGDGGVKWFTLVEGNKGAYKFAAGQMANNTSETRNLTGKVFNGVCGKGLTSNFVVAIPAATVNPLVQVYCASGSISKSVLAKIVAGKVSAVATLGTGTKTRPCVVATIGTDTRATGSQHAVVYYTRVSEKDADGYCGGGDIEVLSRSITTVTSALVAMRAPLTTSPWVGAGGEPAFLQIAAGSSPGTWFGVTNEMAEEYYSPHTATQLFSMTATAITVEADIMLDDTTDFGDWSLVTPRGQRSDTLWTLMVAGSASVDGENIGRATVATIDTETGVVTDGDIVEATGAGYQSGRIIGAFSADSEGNATLYTMVSETQYSAGTWNFAPE